MKSRVIILATIAALMTVMPAAAQMKGGKRHSQDTGQSKKKVDDKGYKSALDRIPDQKVDPWSKVR